MNGEQVIELTLRINVVVRVSVEGGDGIDSTIHILPPMDPPILKDCRACGRSDNECRTIINSTGAARSCCGTCKMTATHGQGS